MSETPVLVILPDLDFEFVSDFDIRISCFRGLPCSFPLKSACGVGPISNKDRAVSRGSCRSHFRPVIGGRGRFGKGVADDHESNCEMGRRVGFGRGNAAGDRIRPHPRQSSQRRECHAGRHDRAGCEETRREARRQAFEQARTG